MESKFSKESEGPLALSWAICVNEIKEECKVQGEDKVQEFSLWFDLKFVSCEFLQDEKGERVNTITVQTESEFNWNTLCKRGYVDRLTKKLMHSASLNNLVLKPFFKANEFDFGEGMQSPTKRTPSQNAPQQGAQSQKRKVIQNSTLIENYNFDNFVTGEGSSTAFACKAAFAVAKNPGTKINPILFYGGVGLGKTHLMQAIGNYINNECGGTKKVCYVQAESFMNEFTYSIVQKNPNTFKNKYRKLDVLLLDDIQFLQNKEGIQQELFYIFEALHKNKAQMVFACDRPLREIKQMEERLVSRLSSGMSLDMEPPNYETRCAIIYKKLQSSGMTLDEDVVSFIAHNVTTNVRDLESALTTLINYCEITSSTPTIDIAKKQLSGFYEMENTGNVSISNILEVVADYYHITVPDLRGKKRDKKRALPRQLVMYLAKELTEYTFTDIGNELGGRDHATIMHGCNKILDEIAIDANMCATVEELKHKVRIS